MKRRQPPLEAVGLPDRLLAAVLAPLFFNISVLIVMLVIFRHSPRLPRFLLAGADIPASLFVMGLAPALTGFLAGTDRMVKLLGHCFYTHLENEQNIVVTLVIWLVLLGSAYAVSQLV
ncbi:hypothetical protein [Zoogloea sp. LCSB751]|uniref:hypothetical protein n=1 Tax=Zoogloea sp. LCSB751 TaxID=1965277 RepID=UPI0009A476AD|nr:hypothetical protein [Zoogloea sp. LCSB751]